ncbi:MAG: diaminopimelate epimerase [Bacteroidetes bacterium]|nr:diaminopimelate epimerase [Bacteroidota bacterium]
MQLIPFTKAHGAKNDFVIVDDRNGKFDADSRRRFARDSAHRRTGIGSDGTIFIDASEHHDFRMAFYNPDGSEGSMCGNGGRCAALYAFTHGIARADMHFEVLGRSYAAEVSAREEHISATGEHISATGEHKGVATQVRLAFPPPLHIEFGLQLETAYGMIPADYVDNGAPHLLVFAQDLPGTLRDSFDALDMERIGPPLRQHPRFSPRGCNVNVLEKNTDGTVRLRTFEKGVEAETWACGTGTLAAGMVAHHRLDLPSPIHLRTHGNDLLTVRFTPDLNSTPDTPTYFAQDLALEGPAVLVYDGTFPL